jgi:hypothetical protein
MGRENIGSAVEGIIKEAAKDLLNASRSDLKAFVAMLTERLTEHVRTGNKRGISATMARIDLAGERARIRANQAAWATFIKVVKTGARGLIVLLG